MYALSRIESEAPSLNSSSPATPLSHKYTQMAFSTTSWLTRLVVIYYGCWLSLFISGDAAVPAVYVFGDSLADVGNNNHLDFTFLKADFPHNGIDYPGGKATGRFSNGKNSADILAEKLGLPSSLPYLVKSSSSSNKTQDFLNGVSFASGGAGVLDQTNSGQCLTLNKQIDYYSTVYGDLVQQLGNTQAQYHLSKSIFATVIGSNDILKFSGSNKPSTTSQQFVDSLITSLSDQLKRIYNLGARKFVIVGTGPIGCCPAQRNQNSSGDCHVIANSLSLLYNQGVASLLRQMKSDLGDINYSFINTYAALIQMIQNPTSYGFTEVKAACCGIGNLKAKIGCLPISSYCHNRTDHIFWDFYHPTETTARILTTIAFEGNAPYVYPINVKQLSTL